MTSRLQAVSFDASDPARLAAFWAVILDREVSDDGRVQLLAGTGSQVGLRFLSTDTEKRGPDRLHLHLTSTGPDGQQETVAAAMGFGARHLDVGQLPDEGHIVLADPEGNAFCVIESGNGFLDGCGFLGEVACDGTRDVGLFWADALGWPLVWDQGQETAIQSPHGGTKVAWGGPPLLPKDGRNRQRFELTVADGTLASEVDRLVALGATRLADTGDDAGDGVRDDVRDDSVELADPDGNEFCLTRG